MEMRNVNQKQNKTKMSRKITNYGGKSYSFGWNWSSVDENELGGNYEQGGFLRIKWRDSCARGMRSVGRSLVGREKSELWWGGSAMSENGEWWRKRECDDLDWKVRWCENEDECERCGENWRRGWVGVGNGGVWPPSASELSSAFFFTSDHKFFLVQSLIISRKCGHTRLFRKRKSDLF